MRSAAIIVAMLWITPALAGASSENNLDPKALSGPDGKGSYSNNPGVIQPGSPGPSGPENKNMQDRGATGEGSGTGSSTSGTGTTGSGDASTTPQPKSPAN